VGAVAGVGAVVGAVAGTTASLELVGGAVVGATAAAQAARSSLAGAGGATAGGTSVAAGASADSSTDRTLGSAVSSTLGSAVSSTRRRGADLAWLLRDHCYVRAVSVERRPVSHDEAQMAKCRLVAPSGSKWDVAEQRFLALEQLFVAPKAVAATAPMTAAVAVAVAAPAPALAVGGAAVVQRPAAAENFAWDGAPQCSSGGGGGGGGGGGDGGVGVGVGAISLLTAAIDTAPKAQLTTLYATIVAAGPAGALPGLHQRLESELRTRRASTDTPRRVERTLKPSLALHTSAHHGAIPFPTGTLRANTDMPRTLKPSLALLPGTERVVCYPSSYLGSSSVLPLDTDAMVAAAAWPLTGAETAAWEGAAATACTPIGAAASGSRGAYASMSSTAWVTAEQFARDPRYCTRAAMRSAGFPMSDVMPLKGGAVVGGH
jgi:hypothetical protein